MKNRIIDFLKGFAIGISNLIPGYSGGTTAVIVNVYDRFVAMFSDIFSHPLKTLKDCWALLLGMVIGVVVGILGIVKLIAFFPVQTAFFIVGLVIASYPGMLISIHKAGSFHIRDVVAFLVCLAMIVILPFLNRNIDNENFNIFVPFIMAFLGALCAAAMVIPGVSGALILLAFGYFVFLMNHLSNIITSITTFSFNGIGISLIVAISFTVGAVLGLVFISKFIKYSLMKWPKTVYMAIFGILVASPFAIFYAIYTEEDYLERIQNTNVFGYIIAIILFFVGTFLVIGVPFILKKNKEKRELKQKEESLEKTSD